MKSDIAIYGGAFNPPTYAHLHVVNSIIQRDIASSVWVCPSYIHRFKDNSVSFTNRFLMCLYAFELIAKCSDIEFRAHENGSDGSTRALVEYMWARENPNFCIIIGEDNAINFNQWKDYEWLIKHVKFVVIPRGGYSTDGDVWYKKDPHQYLADIQPIDYSSTQARSDILTGVEIGDRIHPNVIKLITEKTLYV